LHATILLSRQGGRQRQWPLAATILAARRLIDLDPDKPNMAKGFFVDKAIDDAVFILEKIDERWPTIVNSFSAKES